VRQQCRQPRQCLSMRCRKCSKPRTQSAHRIHHRAVDESRWRAAELLAGRKQGDNVPQSAALPAARRLIGRHLGLRCARNQMFTVPELNCTRIVQSPQHARRRAAPIGRQDGFPDHKNVQVRRRRLSQKAGHCGGPPQTYRSRGREQEHHSRVLRPGKVYTLVSAPESRANILNECALHFCGACHRSHGVWPRTSYVFVAVGRAR
jgi:hypothetical protein